MLKKTIHLFKITLLVCAPCLSFSQKNYYPIKVIPLSKFEFLAGVNNRAPVTVYYEGKGYSLDTEVKREVNFFTLFGFETKRIVPRYTVIVSKNKKYLKNGTISFDKSQIDLLKALLVWGEKFGINSRQVWKLLTSEKKHNKEIIDLLKGVYIVAALNDLEDILSSYNRYDNIQNKSIPIKSIVSKDAKKYCRSINPFFIPEIFTTLQNQESDELWLPDYGLSRNFKASFGIIPEFPISRKNLIIGRFYLTATYSNNEITLNPSNDEGLYIPNQSPNGGQSLVKLVSKENISMNNESASAGLKFNLSLGPIVGTFIEAGFIKQLNDYNLVFGNGVNGYLENGLRLGQSEFEDVGIVDQNSLMRYYKLGFSGIIGKKIHNRSSRRGLLLSIFIAKRQNEEIITNKPIIFNENSESIISNKFFKDTFYFGAIVGIALF